MPTPYNVLPMCAATPKAAPSPRKTLLLVAPQRRVHEVLERLASTEGWELVEARDNNAALSLMNQSAFDLVITGQRTTATQDLELLKRMREIRPHVRMIILTDSRTPGDLLASMRQHVFSFFSTPFNGDYFAHMVRLAMVESSADNGIEVITATPKWVRLSVRCTREAASRLAQFVRQSHVPDLEREEVATASNEIVLNAMEQCGNFDPNQYVEVSYLRMQRAVLCRVKHPGQGFTLDELRSLILQNPLGDILGHIRGRDEQERHSGRFGILLASKLVDEIIFGEQGNDVVLVKYLDSPAYSDVSIKLSDA
jgi:DNA-binding NarL/FixJ family response regulator